MEEGRFLASRRVGFMSPPQTRSSGCGVLSKAHTVLNRIASWWWSQSLGWRRVTVGASCSRRKLLVEEKSLAEQVASAESCSGRMKDKNDDGSGLRLPPPSTMRGWLLGHTNPHRRCCPNAIVVGFSLVSSSIIRDYCTNGVHAFRYKRDCDEHDIYFHNMIQIW